MRQWLDVYPLEESSGLHPARVLFVDIGGGIGHQSNPFRQRLPAEITNQVIVQDLKVAIAHAVPAEGIQAMPYNFFEPEPIEGMYEAQSIKPSMLS